MEVNSDIIWWTAGHVGGAKINMTIQPCSKRRKCIPFVNMENTIVTVKEDNETIDLKDLKKKRGTKITHEENLTREHEMEDKINELKSKGLYDVYMSMQTPKPIRELFKLNDIIQAKRVNRKLSDHHVRSLFAWNMVECSRMKEVLMFDF